MLEVRAAKERVFERLLAPSALVVLPHYCAVLRGRGAVGPRHAALSVTKVEGVQSVAGPVCVRVCACTFLHLYVRFGTVSIAFQCRSRSPTPCNFARSPPPNLSLCIMWLVRGLFFGFLFLVPPPGGLMRCDAML